jgi:hypothetical protein
LKIYIEAAGFVRMRLLEAAAVNTHFAHPSSLHNCVIPRGSLRRSVYYWLSGGLVDHGLHKAPGMMLVPTCQPETFARAASKSGWDLNPCRYLISCRVGRVATKHSLSCRARFMREKLDGLEAGPNRPRPLCSMIEEPLDWRVI